jgi:hypothetical protein
VASRVADSAAATAVALVEARLVALAELTAATLVALVAARLLALAAAAMVAAVHIRVREVADGELDGCSLLSALAGAVALTIFLRAVACWCDRWTFMPRAIACISAAALSSSAVFSTAARDNSNGLLSSYLLIIIRAA